MRPARASTGKPRAAALGDSLDEYNALVVIGVDPVATGRVAVAIGRAQAMKRRVAVGDLFAESPPIQELVHDGRSARHRRQLSLRRVAHEDRVPRA